ncbi:MAG: sensor histidine kinase [Acidimicrobiia bacterium]
MAGPAELARQRAGLGPEQVDHLQRLLAAWSLLADLCFSDLLLFGRVSDGAAEHSFVVLGQIRPTTNQTAHPDDWVGREIAAAERPLVAECFASKAIVDGIVASDDDAGSIVEQCIPVVVGDDVLAVMARDVTRAAGRQAGVLERTYVDVFDRLARMIADGRFPFVVDDERGSITPRVGDGVIVLDGAGRIRFTSPNGVSALHRLGVHENAHARTFAELGLADGVVRRAFASPRIATEEHTRGADVTVLSRVIPLVQHDEVDGGLGLLRDISELRRRDQMLLSKDATIREIHHRVKNNLQTISALLRLQGRRLSSPEAKAAVDESVRRIRSIALVHETLSLTGGDDVAFIDVVRPLARMVEEGLVSPERPVRFEVLGDGGMLSSDVVTPLAVVLTELLQNAVDHAFPVDGAGRSEDPAADGEPARVTVELVDSGTRLEMTVTDNGVGIPPGFDIDTTTGLGLSIVRTLVTSELGGTIGWSLGPGPRTRPGTEVRISVPIRR